MSLDNQALDTAQAALGHRFPASYRARMLRKNGGQLDLDGEPWWLFPIADHTDRKSLARTADDVVRNTAVARSDGLGFPADGIAIAHNDAGDLLLFRAGDPQVWVFRLRGGGTTVAAADFDELTG